MAFLQELDHLKIPFEDIKSATNNFSAQNLLGEGGFGPVYKGQLPSSSRTSKSDTTVAVKRLDVKGGQGEREFLMEIAMLVSYKHDNLVSLVGFSDEGDEKVLVYKHEDNGSLDNHLDSKTLTWEQRLRICIGAARGLEYLHGGVGIGHRVIHRDIKSSNILLDANWEAKISDFGLSKVGPANQQFTFLVTNACGTFGYVDPQYSSTGILTKESDVYSFGVVLFEVLCGRVAFIMKYEDERKFISGLVKFHQEKGTVPDIIVPHLLKQMKTSSLEKFKEIAFRCLNSDRKQRPTMDLVVKDLEIALDHQVNARIFMDSVSEVGPRTRLWGSDMNGSLFYFRLGSNQKLRKIKIIHRGWIHSLTFEVEDSNGLLHPSREYGGKYDRYLNTQTTLIDFDAEEKLIGIHGTYGWRLKSFYLVTSLCFVTNKNTYGPVGKKRDYNPYDSDFSQSWDVGLFDGFYGRSGWYLYALGCCLKGS